MAVHTQAGIVPPTSLLGIRAFAQTRGWRLPWDLRLRSSVLLFRRTTHSRWRKTPPPSRQTEVRENLADARVPRRERNCPRDYIRPPSHETPCLRYTLSVLPVRLW